MLPSRLLRFEVADGFVEPRWLDVRHVRLARRLLERYRALEGSTLNEFEIALENSNEALDTDTRLLSGLRRVIEESIELSIPDDPTPRALRERLFALAARSRTLNVEESLTRASEEFAIPPDEIGERLYGDLRTNRRVHASGLPTPTAVVRRYHLRLVQGLLLHAERLRVDLRGCVRASYRIAKLQGLIVTARPDSDLDVCLEISGPASLLKRTRKYGYALAKFLCACVSADRYRLEARLLLGGERARLLLTECDALAPDVSADRDDEFDSKLEKRFHSDFLRLNSDWEILREANLIAYGAHVAIPDFTLRHRTRTDRIVDLEIVGFWTHDYLSRKLEIYGKVSKEGTRPLILCVADRLVCDSESRELGADVIRFSTRVPVEQVLRRLEELA